MYAAKADGKARHAVFDPTMRARARSRLETEGELRHAILTAAFELAYQPEINLQTAEIEVVEALLRWRMPDGRLARPGEFLGVAEHSGLIRRASCAVMQRRVLNPWIRRWGNLKAWA